MLLNNYIAYLRKYLFIRLIFGQCFHFGKSKFLDNFSRFLCFILIMLSFANFLDKTIYNEIYLYTLCKFIVDCVISFIFRGKYINKLIVVLVKTGQILGVDSMMISWKLFLMLIVIFLYRTHAFFAYSRIPVCSFTFFRSLFIIVSIQLNYISKIIVFDALYQRMKLLRQYFGAKIFTINAVGVERRKYKIENIRSCLSVYDILLEFVENMDCELEIWLLGTVVVVFPDLVRFMYNVGALILKKGLWRTDAISLLIALLLLVLLFSVPMSIFEMAKREVDIIKRILIHQILICTDEVLLIEQQNALDYIKLRPLQLKICRIWSMGITLPFSYCILCVSYVIICAQFTLDS